MIKKTAMKWGAGFAAGAIALAGAGYWLLKPVAEIPPKLDTPMVALAAGLVPPDLVLATPNLAQLPADVIKIPLFKQVLNEDTVDYYEHHSDKLGIEGAIRRIAFENELNLQDHFISALLAEPAELAMWKTDDGRPGSWVLRIKKNNLTQLMTWLAKAALDDNQLAVDGAIGESPLYRLVYSSDDALWFSQRGDQLLVLSDKTLLLDHRHSKAWTKLFDGLLNGSSNPLLQDYGVQAASSGNTVVANMRYLSFGYQSLFDSVKALRLDFGKESWFSHILLSQNAQWDSLPLWQSAPDGAALCLSVPVDWPTLKPLTKKADIPASWLAQLEPAAGICWYADSSLYSPLLLAQTRDPKAFALHAPQLFDWLIGANEGSLAEAESARLPVRKSSKDGTLLLQRAVSADDGNLRSDAKDAAPGVAQLERARYFDVSLAQSGRSIVFSADANLVRTAMDVQQKRYAALADRMSTTVRQQGYANPAALSKLLTNVTMATLPGEAQPLMQHAAVTYLLPHIAAIAEFPIVGLQLTPSADQRKDMHWERLRWESPQ